MEKSINILLVEDEPVAARLNSEHLKKSGYNVIQAFSGAQAVTEAYNNLNRLDLILMDIKMPEMNGLDATRAIRLQKPSQFIIAVTAFALSDDRNRALDAGCDDYISKPITQMKLFEKIGRFLPVE